LASSLRCRAMSQKLLILGHCTSASSNLEAIFSR
jgi:hypothetical protein